jgi:hypothetical protein
VTRASRRPDAVTLQDDGNLVFSYRQNAAPESPVWGTRIVHRAWPLLPQHNPFAKVGGEWVPFQTYAYSLRFFFRPLPCWELVEYQP